jgi:hypothetical protein
MAGQVQVGEHRGAQRQAEPPTVIAVEPASKPVVGQQEELAMQRLWQLDTHSAVGSILD